MKHKLFTKTSIKCLPEDKGLSLEETIRRAIATNQPLEGDAPMIYTPSKDGIRPEYDIRTDRQELALQAMDKYQGSEVMKGFIGRVESDENGTDGKGKKVENGDYKIEE